MCNIYKNNLIVLSQLNDSQLIYYDSENELRPDDRYLSYLRPGTKESKISFIIKNSFLQIFNCNIINLVSQEIQKENDSNIKLIEIENNKHLLRKSLVGLEKYKKTLEEHNHNSEYISELSETLNTIFNNFDEYKLEYLLTIQTPTESKSESKGWLYKLYESTIKSSPPKIESQSHISPSESSDEDTSQFENNLKLEINNSDNENSEDHQVEIAENTTPVLEEQPQLGEYFPEAIEDEDEYHTNYVSGFMYLISRKIFNIFITIGKHVAYFF